MDDITSLVRAKWLGPRFEPISAQLKAYTGVEVEAIVKRRGGDENEYFMSNLNTKLIVYIMRHKFNQIVYSSHERVSFLIRDLCDSGSTFWSEIFVI